VQIKISNFLFDSKLAQSEQFQISNLKTGFSAVFVMILVVIAILGFVVILGVRNIGYKGSQNQQSQQQVEGDAQVRTLESLSNSDEVGAIEQDINSTNLDNLDEGIGEIDKELVGL